MMKCKLSNEIQCNSLCSKYMNYSYLVGNYTYHTHQLSNIYAHVDKSSRKYPSTISIKIARKITVLKVMNVYNRNFRDGNCMCNRV